MPTKVWYHGSPCPRFEAFDMTVIGSGNDELGSGFYFTDSLATAEGYAGPEGWVYEAALEIVAPLTEKSTVHAGALEALIREAPAFTDCLENWGEVAFEGEARIVARAVESYARLCRGSNGALDGLNALSNDFWSGYEAGFLEAAQRLTGYDGLIRRVGGETHAVVWNPASIVIEEVFRPSSGRFSAASI